MAKTTDTILLFAGIALMVIAAHALIGSYGLLIGGAALVALAIFPVDKNDDGGRKNKGGGV